MSDKDDKDEQKENEPIDQDFNKQRDRQVTVINRVKEETIMNRAEEDTEIERANNDDNETLL